MRVPNMKEENFVKNKDLPPNSREKLLLHQRPDPRIFAAHAVSPAKGGIGS
jgi:hypothetical protein